MVNGKFYFAIIVWVCIFVHSNDSIECIYDDEHNSRKFGIDKEDLVSVKILKSVKNRI
jgi:hypothetical protein